MLGHDGLVLAGSGRVRRNHKQHSDVAVELRTRPWGSEHEINVPIILRAVTSSTGRTWQTKTLRDVIKRPRNAGLAVYRREIVGKASFPGVVPEETWRAVAAIPTPRAEPTPATYGGSGATCTPAASAGAVE